jgi:hypothetical protein
LEKPYSSKIQDKADKLSFKIVFGEFAIHEEHRNEEVKRLRIILLKNEYPENIINQTIDKYISRITLPNQPKPQKETKRFIVLSFVSKKAEDFAVRLKLLVEESYSQVDFNVAFKSPKDHRQLVYIQRSNKSFIGSLR